MLLVRAALALWNGAPGWELGTLVQVLDDETLPRVFVAEFIRRGILAPSEAQMLASQLAARSIPF